MPAQRGQLGKYARVGLGLSFAALLGITGVFYWSIVQLRQDFQWVSLSENVLYNLSGALRHLTDAETGQRGYLVTGQERYLEPYRLAESHFKAGKPCRHIVALRELTKDNPAQQERVEAIERLSRKRLTRLAGTIALRRDKGPEAARAAVLTDEGKRIMDDIRNVIAEMHGEEQELLKRRRAGQSASVRFAFSTIGVGVLMIFLTSGLVVWRIYCDIAQRRQAGEVLRKSHERFRTLVNQAADAIFAIDMEGRILDVNREACRSLGYTREELLQLRIQDVDTEVEAHEHQKHQWERLTQGQSVTFEGTQKRKDGTTFPVEIRLGVLDAGPERTLIGLARDITDRKEAQEALQKVHDELEQRVKQRTAELEVANKELESFSYSVSHDLRTPLRGITGFSQALKEEYADKLGPQGRDYLDRVLKGSGRMTELIDDLLRLSGVTLREMKHETVDLSALAGSIAGELRKAEPARQVRFDVEPGLIAHGDVALLRLALQNLMNNAWKFTGGRDRARIEFGALEHDGGRAYFVRDDGVGFDMAYVDKLFIPFQRLHPRAEFSGTGIGLATVSRIIGRHGGKVWGEGQAHKGATFYFTL